MIVGMWMRQKIATSAASGMWIGSGTKQMASPAPNAGVTVRRCSDHRRGSPKKRLNGFQRPVVAQRFAAGRDLAEEIGVASAGTLASARGRA